MVTVGYFPPFGRLTGRNFGCTVMLTGCLNGIIDSTEPLILGALNGNVLAKDAKQPAAIGSRLFQRFRR